jgi:hypothetical protein
MSRKKIFVIELNSSESLVFSSCFGIFFSMPNINKIFIDNIFPIIIENSNNIKLFKLIYIILSLLLIYESYNWIIQLNKKMKKTNNLRINYNKYILKILFYAILGIISAIILNGILFK